MSLQLSKHLVPFVRHGVKLLPFGLAGCTFPCGLSRFNKNYLHGRCVRHTVKRRWQSTSVKTAETASTNDEQLLEFHEVGSSLRACPGCGGLAQTVALGEAGYYSNKRRAVSSYIKSLGKASPENPAISEEDIATNALKQADPEVLSSLGLNIIAANSVSSTSNADHPFCDRCHQLIHHHVGIPIAHPSIDSLHDTISESPHKYNHIYHVLDAADFPLSLVPKIHRLLSISEQRSKNRRAKHVRFRHGKITEMSFIITRSDLLAPKKEQVDSLMPYLTQVLRDALGSSGENVRLGNVRCVSAKRGWWTRELKADIWDRGGGGWMVGKVNVGKSNLFEVVFPKGRVEDINFDAMRRQAFLSHGFQRLDLENNVEVFPNTEDDSGDLNSLLPPARQETPFPIMPTVSSLPGTTASPIRIPFGNGKGELIDLPGLARSNLDTFVREEDRDTLVMKARITPEQHVIKPGQSLLLGGLIRITPLDPDTVILAYPFVPLRPHLTSTEKAIALQTGALLSSGVANRVADDSAHTAAASAGTFPLKWDVTRQRAGPLTSSSAAGLKPKTLPFKVLSADILIEGVGWVELVAQVRKKRLAVDSSSSRRMEHISGLTGKGAEMAGADEPTHFPQVEVFSPKGRFVGVRRPMNAWLLGGLASKPGKGSEKGRPRRSMASLRRSRKSAEESRG